MPNEQSEISSAFSQPSKPSGSITSETIDKLISAADTHQHPYGKAWPRFDCDTFGELCDNIQARGLDQDILLYQDMILEGWHRYLACRHTNTEPRFVVFEGTDLDAAEKVHSSGIRRQSSADQRYAAFLMLGEACPEFLSKHEKLSQQGIAQRNAGTPLSTGEQRVDVVGVKAAAAGVSRATAAKVEKVKKVNPEAVIAIAKGKTTANKELKAIRAKESLVNSADMGTKSAGVDKIENPKNGELKTAFEDTDSAAIELNTLTKSLMTFQERLDRLDWSNESNDEWELALAGLKTVGEQISDKVLEGFKKANITQIKGIVPKRKTKPKPPSDVLSIKKLKTLFGEYALAVLGEYLKELPRKGGAMRSYKAIKCLPTQDEFNELQKIRYTSTASDLVNDAFIAFEDLASECSEWYDNLPESFRDGDKGSMLEDAMSTLESLSLPECSEITGAIKVYYLPMLDCSSRSSRRDDAVGQLEAVVDALEEAKEDGSKFDKEEIESVIAELRNAINEAEGVEFPGMYG